VSDTAFMLDSIETRLGILARRLEDETGAIRQFVGMLRSELGGRRPLRADRRLPRRDPPTGSETTSDSSQRCEPC
jgi:hypothetical protein